MLNALVHPDYGDPVSAASHRKLLSGRIDLDGIIVDVIKKKIKNVHLRVYPPAGRVRVSAPLHMNLDTIRVFALSKLGWIKQQQRKLQTQARETPREYIDRESHHVWGRRLLLKVVEKEATPVVQMAHETLLLQVRPGSTVAKRKAVLEDWLREELRAAVPPLIAKWEPRLGVKAEKVVLQQMKTRWGSCNTRARRIRLNTELAKKPPECLEYIVVHELAHLLERSHNQRFKALMNQFMPKWKYYRDVLNRRPVVHEDWEI